MQSEVPTGEPILMFTASEFTMLCDKIHPAVDCGPDCFCWKIKKLISDFEFISTIRRATDPE